MQFEVSEGPYQRLFQGIQSPTDLESAFQLIHLLFTTQVSVDESELTPLMRIVRQGLEAQVRDPAFPFNTRVKEVNYGNSYYFKPMTAEGLASIDPHLSCSFHNMNYRNPAEFVLVLTGEHGYVYELHSRESVACFERHAGNIDVDSFRPLVSKFLASIPSTKIPAVKAAAEISPLKVTFPSGTTVEDVKVSRPACISHHDIVVAADKLYRARNSRELIHDVSLKTMDNSV